MSKYGDLDLIWAFLKCHGMDLNRHIECMKDPGNKDVVVFGSFYLTSFSLM